MRIGFVTNLRAPYRTLQINEFLKIKDTVFNVYYTDNKNEGRTWRIDTEIKFNEIDLKGYRLFSKYGYINRGLFNIVNDNDFIILGGYDQPSYILVSIICKIFNKPYVLLYDGISCDKIYKKENYIKKLLKKIVIDNSKAIMGNGQVSREYFLKNFNYSADKIFNQYLTVDISNLNNLYNNKELYRKEYRSKLGIENNAKVLVYSGRLVEIKNIEAVIIALEKIKSEKIVFLITGGGKLQKTLMDTARKLGVKLIITGFISRQEELFKHYFAGDAFILPSVDEPWGLVVNEAMAAGLPVIVSNICGCSLDLVQDGVNGYIIDPYNIGDISDKIKRILLYDNYKEMGLQSRKIIKNWNFSSSAKNLNKIINSIMPI